MDRHRAVGGAQAHRRRRLRLRARTRRGVRLQGRLALRPRLFPPQGRKGGAGSGDLEGRLRPHAHQAGGGARCDRLRQAHHLCRLVQIPDRGRGAGARRHRRVDEAARRAQEKACRRGAVRRSAQAVAAVPARGDRRRHLADRGCYPRHFAPPRRPLSAPRAGVAGAGAGRGFRRRSGKRHQRLQRAAGAWAVAAARSHHCRAWRRFVGGPVVVQRGDRGTGGGREHDPADLRGRPRDGYHADRFRFRPARADAHRRRRNGGAGARRIAG